MYRHTTHVWTPCTSNRFVHHHLNTNKYMHASKVSKRIQEHWRIHSKNRIIKHVHVQVNLQSTEEMHSIQIFWGSSTLWHHMERAAPSPPPIPTNITQSKWTKQVPNIWHHFAVVDYPIQQCSHPMIRIPSTVVDDTRDAHKMKLHFTVLFHNSSRLISLLRSVFTLFFQRSSFFTAPQN